MILTLATLCSGMGAPEVAARGLGFRPLWQSEIEPAACAVLAHRWPDAPNLGDMTAPDFVERAAAAGVPDVLVAGTPCQAFSVAGMRRSLDDARGNLTLQLVRILDGLDATRSIPDGTALLWENVPGVLSTKDNAFGCLLAALCGEEEPLVAPGGRWTDAGVVIGPERRLAWRVLDAQGFDPQRRRRVFLVATRPGHWLDPERVLFETEAEALGNLGDALGLAGAPSGAAAGGLAGLYQKVLPLWQGVRGDSEAGVEEGQGAARDAQAGAGSGCVDTVPTLTSSGRGVSRPGESRGQDPLAPCWWDSGDVSQTLDAVLAKGESMPEKNRFPAVLVPETSHTLRGEGFDASEDGTGRGTPLVAEVAPPVTSNQYGDHESREGLLVPLAFPERMSGTQYASGENLSPALGALNPTAVATLAIRGRDDGATLEARFDDTANTVLTPSGGRAGIGVGAIATAYAVRRLTPVECLRLQGFPDDHLDGVLLRGKPLADGPKYKLCGNSMNTKCVRWILARIAAARIAASHQPQPEQHP